MLSQYNLFLLKYHQNKLNEEMRIIQTNQVLQELSLLHEKMKIINQSLFNIERGYKPQEQPSSSPGLQISTQSQQSDQQLITKDQIERYKMKEYNRLDKRNQEIRKYMASKRLRINGQFLNYKEQKRVQKMKMLLGSKYILIKNNNIKSIGFMQKLCNKKEKMLLHLEKIAPNSIIDKIISKKPLFKIL